MSSNAGKLQITWTWTPIKYVSIIILLQTDENNLWVVFLDLFLRSTLSHCGFISSQEWSINGRCKTWTDRKTNRPQF